MIYCRWYRSKSCLMFTAETKQNKNNKVWMCASIVLFSLLNLLFHDFLVLNIVLWFLFTAQKNRPSQNTAHIVFYIVMDLWFLMFLQIPSLLVQASQTSSSNQGNKQQCGHHKRNNSQKSKRKQQFDWKQEQSRDLKSIPTKEENKKPTTTKHDLIDWKKKTKPRASVGIKLWFITFYPFQLNCNIPIHLTSICARAFSQKQSHTKIFGHKSSRINEGEFGKHTQKCCVFVFLTVVKI